MLIVIVMIVVTILVPILLGLPSVFSSHSTTDDTYPSNAAVPHSIHAAAPRLRGCARHPFGSLCLVLLPLFQPRAGASWSSSARACGVAAKNQSAPATTNATAVLVSRRVKIVLLFYAAGGEQLPPCELIEYCR